jgi:hypothetical protein
MKRTSENPQATIVEVGQYYSCEFTGNEKVATDDVSSCVVLLVKNFRVEDGSKECSHLAMGHFNMANLCYPDVAMTNVLNMLKDFQSKGGKLEEATFAILGGVDPDINEVREMLRASIRDCHENKLLSMLPEVKEPKGYTSRVTESTMAKMTFLIDKNGTYTRKDELHRKDGKGIKFELSKGAEQFLSNETIRTVVPFSLNPSRQIAFNEARKNIEEFHKKMAPFVGTGKTPGVEAEKYLKGLGLMCNKSKSLEIQ